MRAPVSRLPVVTLPVLALLASSAGAAPEAPADLILYDAHIVTEWPGRPEAQAIAVAGDRIVAVGSDPEVRALAGAHSRTIDLHGMTVVPGLIDSHAHFLETGEALGELDLSAEKAPAWDDIVREVGEAARRARPGEWILGKGWHQERWTRAPRPSIEGLPAGHELDAVSPRNPVLLEHASGHAIFVNSVALKLAGIGPPTPDPPGGEIVRDQAGRPIGMLRDAAMKPVLAALDKARAAESPAEKRKRLLEAVALATHDALEQGVTSWQDMGEPFETIDFYERLATEGKLGVRLYAFVSDEPVAALRAHLAEHRLIDYGRDHLLTVRGIGEILSDGALGTHSAWFFAPYVDVPTTRGYNVTPLETIRAMAEIAMADDFQVSVHAIGARANHEVLDLYQQVMAEHPDKKDLRWRIDHAQHLLPSDIPRFGALHVIASMQTGHACDDAPYVVRRIGAARAASSYAWHSLIAQGAVIANGTDAPVIPIDTLPNFFCAVTRHERFSPEAPVFYPREVMTRMEALHSYTDAGAYSMFKERELGTLEPGKLADLVVLDRDILSEPAPEILKTRIIYTVLNGKVVYRGGTAPTRVPERRGTELGFAVFQQHCVSCHGNPAFPRAPTPAALRAMSPERIYTALTAGVMKTVGDTLSDADRRRVAESLAGQLLGSARSGDASTMPNRCVRNPPLRPLSGPRWNGWGNGLENHRFQSAQAAGLSAASVPHLELKWAFGFPGGTSAYGQPTVVAGRVFVGTDTGYVYSLDASSGCIYWSYRSRAGVRNAMTLGPIKARGAGRYAVFFGDLKANTYAIDAQSGRQIWVTHVENNFATRVTAAPALYQGRLYVPISAWEGFSARVLDYPCCTAVGSVSALDANTGRLLWKTYTIAERPHPTRKNSRGIQLWAPAGVPVWNTPTIDTRRHAIYFGTGDASTYPAPATSDAVLALDMATGRMLWSRQIYPNDAFIVGCTGGTFTENCPKVVGPDWDIPMSPMLETLRDGRSLVIFGTKPGEIIAIDPDARGKPVWRVDVAREARPVEARTTPSRTGGGNLGPLWGGAIDESNVYFGLNAGGAVALRTANGERLWYTRLAPTGKDVTYSAAATVIPGVVFVAGSDGRLWALATRDGHPLWSFDTARAFRTVNDVPAHGGSISAPGPTVAGGMLFVGSGYGVVSQTPGNVLLAFSVPGGR
jgi:predicted amidohydrolase YtcJ/outer membrane protein assembly factor BamB/cytochrome c553